MSHRLPPGKEAWRYGLCGIEARCAGKIRRACRSGSGRSSSGDKCGGPAATRCHGRRCADRSRTPWAPALSLRVPPSWNVTSELNGRPMGALVVQSRSVTCTDQEPASSLESEPLEPATARLLAVVRRRPVRPSRATTDLVLRAFEPFDVHRLLQCAGGGQRHNDAGSFLRHALSSAFGAPPGHGGRLKKVWLFPVALQDGLA